MISDLICKSSKHVLEIPTIVGPKTMAKQLKSILHFGELATLRRKQIKNRLLFF